MTEETKWKQEGKREMKERWEVFRESLKEAVTVSRKEYLLVTVVCVLGGIVFGLLFSPRKYDRQLQRKQQWRYGRRKWRTIIRTIRKSAADFRLRWD